MLHKSGVCHEAECLTAADTDTGESGFQHEHSCLNVLAQSVGHHAACRSCADNDVVKFLGHGYAP